LDQLVNRIKFILMNKSQVTFSFLNSLEAYSHIIISRLLKSLCLCLKVIPLNGFHCSSIMLIFPYFISGTKDLLDLFNKNQDSHFFLDEVHVSQNQISSKVLADMSNKMSKDNFLWIACQGDRLPSKSDPNLTGNTCYTQLFTERLVITILLSFFGGTVILVS
jgi:hypothetical protein